MVYQDLALCDNLEIVENIFLGRELTRFELGRFKVIDKERMLARSQELLDILDLAWDQVVETSQDLWGTAKDWSLGSVGWVTQKLKLGYDKVMGRLQSTKEDLEK